MADTQQTVLAGRYRLVDQLGRGGMGTVWRAHDELLGRDVAVKEVLLPHGVDDDTRDDLLERTKREARAAARLNHPNVVTIFDVVEVDGRPWIVMELVKSRGLNQIVREEGPLPPERVASIGVQLLNALGVAHASGIFHRDVKPSNVLVSDNGRVVLADFGIASVQGDPAMTRSGLILGSPSYIAPERARGLQAGAASDLWAVGATLYTAVEGRPPYDRDGIVPILTAAAMEDPDPYRLAGPLAPVLTALLQREPDKRPQIDAARRALRQVALLDTPAAPKRGKANPKKTAVLPAVEVLPPAPRTPPDATAEPAAAAVPAAENENEQAAAFGSEPVVEVPVIDPVSPVSPPVPPKQPRRASIPMPAPEPTPVGTTYNPRRNRNYAIIAAVLAAVVLIAVAGILLVNRDDNSSATQSSSATTSAKPNASASASSKPSSKPTAAATTSAPTASATTAGGVSTIPAGWYKYNGPGGFTIGVPNGWNVQESSAGVRIQNFKGLFLLIQQSNQPKADAKADWEQQARARANSLAGYQQISIKAINYRNYKTAADWEFLFNKNGTQQHVLNRGFVTGPSQAYGLYWQTDATQWAAGQSYFQTFADTFQPAS